MTALSLSLALIVAGCGDADAKKPQPVQQTAQGLPPATPEATTVVPPHVPAPTTVKAKPRTKAPEALIGTWDGDRAQLSFSREGDVTFTFKQGGSDSGTVVIDGSSMTLHLSSSVVSVSRWEISRFDAGYGYEFFKLTLDGTSYVRDVPK